MRVAFISSGWPEYTLLLANALSELSEVHLFYPDRELDGIADLLNASVQCHYYGENKFRSLKNMRTTYRLCGEISSLDPDIVHFQGNIFWFTPFWRRLNQYPTVITIHDPWLHKGEWRFSNWIGLHLSLRMGNYFTVHGNHLRTYMVDHHRISPERVHNIPHGEFSIYKNWLPPGIVEEKNTVLFFGRIYPYKGLHVLVEAAPMIRELIPNVRFIVAGSRGGRYLRNLCKIMAANDYFDVLNRYIPRKLVAELFQRTTVVVLPYVDATQSGVIPIAYGFGKPVIATNVGSLDEVVDDGISGILVKPDDAKALANAIVKILSDAHLRQSVGKAGLRKAKTELSWMNIAAHFIKVYQQAIQNFNE